MFSLATRACILLSTVCAVLGAAPPASYSVTLVSNLSYAQGLINCPYGVNRDPENRCTPFSLLLDVYIPEKAPPGRPAMVLAHGGGNSGGVKEQNCFQGTAQFFASRGFVAFNIDYRLSGQKGTYPQSTVVPEEWNPSWPSAYPAVRDFKAAVRFVRANADKYNINTSRIVGTGGSAGATNALATGITLEDDYKTELTLEQDPTLATTHLNESSRLAVVYTHWSSDGEVALALEHNGGASRYSASNPPVVEFHGTADTTINISHALAVQHQYSLTGVPYELHALQGCPHGSWAYGCRPASGDHPCQFANGTAGYCSTMDEQAWPFISQHLGL